MLHFAGAIVNSMQMTGQQDYVVMVIACSAILITEYHSFSLLHVMRKNRDNVSIYNAFGMVYFGAKAVQAVYKSSNAPIIHLEVEPQQLLLDEDGRGMRKYFNMAGHTSMCESGISCPSTTWVSSDRLANPGNPQ